MIWISIDPGEDAGWALWDDTRLLDAGTFKLWELIDKLSDAVGSAVIVDESDPWQRIEKFVIEDWALYPWKLKEMAWDKCRTARGIGALELIGRSANIPIDLQPAKIKESAISGGARELFRRPLHENRHANDAIMHGFWHIQRSKASNMKNAKARATRIHKGR